MRIELERATVVYRNEGGKASPALAPATLSVEVGECVAVVGPTGSGKTTLLDVMAGLRTPTTGVARVEPGGGGANHRRRVGLVAQFPEDQFFEETLFDEVAFGLRRQDVPDDAVRERVEAALRRAALDADEFLGREPSTLSAGEARRAAIASILVLGRPFLLLDEPTAGLDPGTRSRVVELMRSERDEGTGVVFVTHDLDLASELARRVVVMSRGRIVHDGEASDVLAGVDGLVELGLEPPMEYALVAALEKSGSAAAGPVRRALLG